MQCKKIYTYTHTHNTDHQTKTLCVNVSGPKRGHTIQNIQPHKQGHIGLLGRWGFDRCRVEKQIYTISDHY